MDPATLEGELRGRFGRPCRFLPEVGSTNTEALAWAADGADEGAIVTTDHQTSGRGRRGRTWFDEPGSSVMFSLVLRPRVRFERLGLLPVALGIAVAEALETSCGIPALTKWPNDVTVEGRKIAGILVETKLVGSRADIAVAGVGVNHDWSGIEVPVGLSDTATSMQNEVEGELPSRVEVLAEILAAFEDLYGMVVDEGEHEDLLARARDRSAVLGHRIGIRTAEGSLVLGTACDLMLDGALLVDVDGEARAFNVGEIEQLRPLEG
jgi:BirA family biotin operon repressor/biotin-[acetyl-CoA-carboxylase] ligase